MRLRLSLLAAIAVLAVPAAAATGASAPSIFTVVGSSGQGFGGDGKPATGASLNGPAGLAVAADGSIFVADTINQRIRRVAPGGTITTIAGTGKTGSTGDGGPATQATLQDPTALALAPDGSLYIADTGNSKLRVVRPSGVISTVAGTADQGFSGDGGPASSAQVNAPGGVAVGGDGTVFFSDTGNNRIRAVRPDGTIATVAGTGVAGFAGDGGQATAAQLKAPAGLAAAADGSLLVADSGNARIRRIGSDGHISTVAGNGGSGSAGDGGPATAAQLNRPLDVAAIPGGGFLIAETGGNRVRAVSQNGTIVRLAGAGGPRFGGDGGTPLKALLNAPWAVELMPSGAEVLIADSDNNRVRYIASPGSAKLLAIAPRKTPLTAALRTITVKNGKRVGHTRVVSDTRIPYVVSLTSRIKVAIRKKSGGKAVATIRAKAQAGSNKLALPLRLRAGRHRLGRDHYVVKMTATANGATAVASLELIVR